MAARRAALLLSAASGGWGCRSNCILNKTYIPEGRRNRDLCVCPTCDEPGCTTTEPPTMPAPPTAGPSGAPTHSPTPRSGPTMSPRVAPIAPPEPDQCCRGLGDSCVCPDQEPDMGGSGMLGCDPNPDCFHVNGTVLSATPQNTSLSAKQNWRACCIFCNWERSSTPRCVAWSYFHDNFTCVLYSAITEFPAPGQAVTSSRCTVRSPPPPPLPPPPPCPPPPPLLQSVNPMHGAHEIMGNLVFTAAAVSGVNLLSTSVLLATDGAHEIMGNLVFTAAAVSGVNLLSTSVLLATDGCGWSQANISGGGAEELRIALHPLQIKPFDSYLAGAVIGNVAICFGIVITHTLLWRVAVHMGSDQGSAAAAASMRHPGFVFPIAMCLYQGTAVAAAKLLMRWGDGELQHRLTGVGGALLGVVGLPAALWLLVLRPTQSRAVYMHEPTARRNVMVWTVATAEWCSRGKDLFAQRWGAILRSFRPPRYSATLMLQCAAMAAIGGLSAYRIEDFQSCAQLHFAMAGVMFIYAEWCATLGSFARPWETVTESLAALCLGGYSTLKGFSFRQGITVTQTAGGFLDYTTDDMFGAAGKVLLAAQVLLLIRIVADVIVWRWASKRGRGATLQLLVDRCTAHGCAREELEWRHGTVISTLDELFSCGGSPRVWAAADVGALPTFRRPPADAQQLKETSSSPAPPRSPKKPTRAGRIPLLPAAQRRAPPEDAVVADSGNWWGRRRRGSRGGGSSNPSPHPAALLPPRRSSAGSAASSLRPQQQAPAATGAMGPPPPAESPAGDAPPAAPPPPTL
eukprot:TRINITY_DN9040_c0_g1_i1.p1 TRINITY_DN9040_c0_g1~~TRINITY_DN9040_c0_g1_i1.p1  ORF type:complete len:827 (+),score=162.43 TRINITY_DN9040_c0_g1_i1:85-2481(+)